MKQHQAFAALRDVLTELYRVEEMTRTVALDARLDLGQIAFSGRVKDIWTAILGEAEEGLDSQLSFCAHIDAQKDASAAASCGKDCRNGQSCSLLE